MNLSNIGLESKHRFWFLLRINRFWVLSGRIERFDKKFVPLQRIQRASTKWKENEMWDFFCFVFNRRRYADFVTFIHERYNNVFVTVSSLLGDITDNWRLFIGSSKRNLKCVLLHNTNRYAISLAHSIVVKKHYDGIKRVLQKWNIMI